MTREGTGKTYLSAFDAKNFKPKKFLFVVHREQILKQAEKSYKDVFGSKINTGFYTGLRKDKNADFLFATVQTLSKDENLEQFDKEYFDMIVYDEIHKSGSATYEKIINYFKPKFMLGMSATPERTDGKDIYSLFDNNIAYEIRLQEALEEDLLCPFHYFGITDIEINGETINDKSDFNLLIDEIRVNYILEKVKYYGHSGNKVHGLVFCSRKEEAYKLAEIFTKRGFPSVGLTGEDSQETREKAVKRLEKNKDDIDHLDYIFTVDIFNEGIDIPCVNQIIMIRSTKSSIIFTQQLGRGLRKFNNKDYVVILDFIGNYDNNYLIPIALFGDRTFNKDNLRRGIFSGSSIIPGCSTIHFDKISKDRILKSIDNENFSTMRKINTAYNDLKIMLGKIPTLEDFYKFGSIDVMRIIEHNSFASYYDYLVKKEKNYKIRISNVSANMLSFVDKKLMYGKSFTELYLLKLIIEGSTNLINDLKNNKFNKEISDVEIQSIKLVLQNRFITSKNYKNKFKHAIFVDDNLNPNKLFLNELKNKNFKELILSSINEGLRRNILEYNFPYKNTNFSLNKKYTYEDVCRLLNWDKNIVSLNIGGYKYDHKTNTLPVFINYDKEDYIQDSIKYHDRFLSNTRLMWMSKSGRNLESIDVRRIMDKENPVNIFLFVRKNKDDSQSKEFYFLGSMKSINKPFLTSMPDGKSVVEIEYKLDTPVKEDIYEYIKGEE